MKKTAFLLLPLFFASVGYGQVPQALNYQAIARNSGGQIIPSQSIGVRFSISDVTGNTIFYRETHSTVTNAFGLFTLAIGRGTAVSGTIPQVDWSAGGDKYLKVEIAPQGGTNYTMQGSTQLLSVPYALYAEKTKLTGGNAITITNGNTINANYVAGPGINIAGNIISATAASSWLLAGNSGTTTANFLGTTDNENLRFKTFNQQRMMIDVNGNVGINTPTPSALLHTKGSLRFEDINTNNTLTRVLVMDNNGNVSSRDANTLGGTGSYWSLTGNAGTTNANFLGTTDNQSIFVRTNNTNRLMIDAGQPITGGNLSTAFFSDFTSIKSAPAQLAIYGKDVIGVSVPMHVFSSVEGMNWTAAGGTNNTLGRFLRFTQMNSPTYSTGQFYDFGIDQGFSFFISNRGLNSTGGALPKKMLTISPQDFVGINFDWGQNPTANFHTRGTVRFEGINTNNTLTRLVAMDANGNVSARDVNTLNGFWVADADGIHNNNSTNHVGIGTASNNQQVLNVAMMDNSVDGRPMAKFTTNDSWQTNLWMFNTSNSASFSLIVGGSANTISNYGVGAHGFGIANQRFPTTTIPFIITTDNNVGISNSLGGTNNQPKSRLHVRDGDIYIDNIGSGVIMKSPDGQCWRMTVSNAGIPVFAAITCP